MSRLLARVGSWTCGIAALFGIWASVAQASNLDMRGHLVLGHDRCVSASSYTIHGQGIGILTDQEVYDHYAEYRQCGEKRTFAPTHRPDPNRDELSIDCRRGFRLAGSATHDIVHLTWWVWLEGGRWNINELGASGYSHWLTGFGLEMQNLDVGGYWPDHDPHPWAARLLATCERIPNFRF
jgi:hypothetical protein